MAIAAAEPALSNTMMEDITQSLSRLNQLSFRLRLLREQAVWQREATSTVTELLAAAADLESLAAERMRLLATVNQIRRKPKRFVPPAAIAALATPDLDGDAGAETCNICLCRLDGGEDDGDDGPAPKSGVCVLPCRCRRPYHRDCLATWLANSHTCPSCRFEMPYVPGPEKRDFNIS